MITQLIFMTVIFLMTLGMAIFMRYKLIVEPRERDKKSHTQES